MMTLSIGMEGFLGFGTRPRRKSGGAPSLVAAAEAHILWKARLGHHIYGSIREPLESATVGQDGICQLGSWINSQGLEPFHGNSTYQQLRDAHRQFHRSGTLIIEKLRAGDRNGAEQIFINEYSQSLRDIIQSLVEINSILPEDQITRLSQ